MKTFGELEIGSFVYFIPNSLDYFDMYKIIGITNQEQGAILISVDYEYGFTCHKNESISTAIDGAYCSCEEAIEKRLSVKSLQEDLRHSRSIELIQEYREKYKTVLENFHEKAI